MSPNEIIFGHKLNDPLAYMSVHPVIDVKRLKEINQQEAQKAIDQQSLFLSHG